ncbi:MAG: hypothetical protein ABIQ44_00165 [Chloroflexia bacterium]
MDITAPKIDPTTNNRQPELPIACDLTQIPAAQLSEHEKRAQYLFGPGMQESRELTNGYAMRFSPNDYPTLCDFIAHERLCCPFFQFTLELQPNSGPIWLQITGQPGAKELLSSALLSTGIQNNLE